MIAQDPVNQTNNNQARILDSNTCTAQVNNCGMVVQFSGLLKIILVNQFICDFVFACQCIWVLNLMTIYQTTRIADTLIWVFPFFMSVMIKPYLLIYAKTSLVTISTFLKIIIACYILIVFGQYFIIISTEPQRLIETHDLTIQYKKLRILIAFVGFTITEVALETIYNFNEQIEAIIIYNSLEHSIEEISKVSLFAKVNAYLLCALALMRVTTYRNYYFRMSQIYYVCGLLCLTGGALMYNFNNFKVTQRKPIEPTSLLTTIVKKELIDNPKRQKKLTLSDRIKDWSSDMYRWMKQFSYLSKKYSNLRGFLRIWEAPMELKLYLLVAGITNIIMNTVQFYCAIWMTESLGKNHTINDDKYGLQLGSVMLSVFFASTYFVKEWIGKSWRDWKQIKSKRIFYEIVFIVVTVLTGIACFLSVHTHNTIFICISIFLCSTLVSNLQIFLQNDEQSINRFHPQFQVCQNAMFRFSNYLTLLLIPFYLNLVGERSPKIDALNFIIILAFILLVLKIYYLTKIQKKEKKEDFKESKNIMDMNKSQLFERSTIPITSMLNSSTRSNKEPMSGKLLEARRKYPLLKPASAWHIVDHH